MNKQRAAAEAEIYKWVDKLIPGGGQSEKFKALFADMSDAQFHKYMEDLRDGREILTVQVPNLTKTKLSIENNFKVAKELGHEFFQRLWLTDPATGRTYLTPRHYLVIDLPFRRQQQMLVKKSSIPETNRHVDEMSGQPSGDSHSSSLTFPELQVLYARGCNKSIEELIKFRGGDTKAFLAMNRVAAETGGVSLDAVSNSLGPTRVKSTETLGVLLQAAHLSHNL